MADEHETAVAASGLDLDVIRELSRECGWTLGEFAEFYLSGTGKQLESLGAGIAAGDVDEVRRLAHGGVYIGRGHLHDAFDIYTLVHDRGLRTRNAIGGEPIVHERAVGDKAIDLRILPPRK